MNLLLPGKEPMFPVSDWHQPMLLSTLTTGQNQNQKMTWAVARTWPASSPQLPSTTLRTCNLALFHITLLLHLTKTKVDHSSLAGSQLAVGATWVCRLCKSKIETKKIWRPLLFDSCDRYSDRHWQWTKLAPSWILSSHILKQLFISAALEWTSQMYLFLSANLVKNRCVPSQLFKRSLINKSLPNDNSSWPYYLIKSTSKSLRVCFLNVPLGCKISRHQNERVKIWQVWFYKSLFLCSDY